MTWQSISLEQVLWMADAEGNFDELKEELGVPEELTLYPPTPNK